MIEMWKLIVATVVLIGFGIWAIWFIKTTDRELEEDFKAYREYVYGCFHNN